MAISVGFSALLAIAFSLIRPYNQAVYAPKLKHADEKHAPLPIGKKPWSWITVLLGTKEDHLIQQIGMDAIIFLRFIRMCRNMFLVLSVFGMGILVPTYVTQQYYTGPSNNVTPQKRDGDGGANNNGWLLTITPRTVKPDAMWAQVVVAYLMNFTVAGFLWWNYRRVMELRRKYFDSDEYQSSLHSRTLMLFDLPREASSDEGIARIIDGVVPNASFARTAIARNVKGLPDLIEQHSSAVRKLEEVLAKYLKHPQALPEKRPTCKPSKKDRNRSTYPSGQRIDAIDYYTNRIKDLEVEIKAVRAAVDRRSTMPYGFASYSDISEAHSIAYSCRKQKPNGATITLAPQPSNIIWKNMSLSSSLRSRRRFANSIWISGLTLLWVAPNALIAVFLVNLSRLGQVWPSFQTTLEAHPHFWGAVQGVAAPLVTSLFYLVLPMIFRRLAIKGGDQTKTGRDRHVIAKLFAFFLFNNLFVFSLFGVIFVIVTGIVKTTEEKHDAWEAIKNQQIPKAIVNSLCSTSIFWVTYLLQRQLGATIDLAQLWPLFKSAFLRKFSSPTPRELIEMTAPPPFDYAGYYTYFLFYSAVSLCFAGIQPLVLLATALYFCVDVYLKKYLLLYRFVTKNESGGLVWRTLFNRLIFSLLLADAVVLLTCWANGDGQHYQFYTVVPLFFIVIGFKFYCSKTFDDKIRFYSLRNVRKNPEAAMQKDPLRNDRLTSKFGHPALYKKLITPMVHQKAQNMLPSIYSGRLTEGREGDAGDMMSVSGYSDMYALDAMAGGKVGKKAGGVPGFEFVSESHLDFEYYKNRADFAEEFGGAEIYGSSITRPTTPGSVMDLGGGMGGGYPSRPGTPGSGRSTPFGISGNSAAHHRVDTAQSDTSYRNYRLETGTQDDGSHNRMGSYPDRTGTASPFYNQDNSSGSALMHHAATSSGRMSPAPGRMSPGPGRMSPAPLGRKSPGPGHMSPALAGSRPTTPGPSVGALGGGPGGYAGLVQHDDEVRAYNQQQQQQQAPAQASQYAQQPYSSPYGQPAQPSHFGAGNQYSNMQPAQPYSGNASYEAQQHSQHNAGGNQYAGYAQPPHQGASSPNYDMQGHPQQQHGGNGQQQYDYFRGGNGRKPGEGW